MIGTLCLPAHDDDTVEAAIIGDEPRDGLVAVMRQMLASHREHRVAKRDEQNVQSPL